MLASARLPVTRPRCVSLAVLLWLPGIILLVPKEELAGVSLQVLILGPLSVSALWVRKHPDTKCRDGWRASVLYLDSLGYCCRFCAPKKNWQGCLYRCWSWARYPSPHCGSGSTQTQSAATVGGPRFFTSIPWGIAAVFVPQRRTGRGVFTGVDLGPAIRLCTVGPEAPRHKVLRRLAGLGSLPRFPGVLLPFFCPKEELAGVSLQVLILGPLSVSPLWVRKHPDTKCRDGWRASVLYLDSLGYCCRFCAKQIKDYKQSGRVVLKGHERKYISKCCLQNGSHIVLA